MTTAKPLTLLALESALVRHGVIHAAAIEDPEGYDEGETREGVLRVFEEITGMVGRREESEAQRAESGGQKDECGNSEWDADDEFEPREEYMDDEYCGNCGRPSHAIDNGMCPMCFELNGGIMPSRTILEAKRDHEASLMAAGAERGGT